MWCLNRAQSWLTTSRSMRVKAAADVSLGAVVGQPCGRQHLELLAGCFRYAKSEHMGMLTFSQPKTSYAASPDDLLHCMGPCPPAIALLSSRRTARCTRRALP